MRQGKFAGQNRVGRGKEEKLLNQWSIELPHRMQKLNITQKNSSWKC